MTTETLKVTSADEYVALPHESEGQPYKMPSGAVWLISQADMEDLALSGDLPMSLVSAAIETRSKDTKNVDVEAEIEPDKVDEQLLFAREMTREYVLVPQLGYGGPRNALGVIDSKGEWHKCKRGDLTYAWQLISGQEGADGLDSFRPNRKQRRALASKSGREALQPKPVVAAAEK